MQQHINFYYDDQNAKASRKVVRKCFDGTPKFPLTRIEVVPSRTGLGQIFVPNISRRNVFLMPSRTSGYIDVEHSFHLLLLQVSRIRESNPKDIILKVQSPTNAYGIDSYGKFLFKI